MKAEPEILKQKKRHDNVLALRLRELSAARANAAIAAELFRRAPIEFLEERTVSDLSNIVALADKNLCAFRQRKVPVEIQTAQIQSSTVITISIADRAYVVNTVMECCREEEVRVLTLLHPVFTSENPAISFNYLELAECTPQKVAALIEKLREALELLIPVTIDYADTVAATGKLAQALSPLKGSKNEDALETSEFLKWLLDGEFNFLGYGCWEITPSGPEIKLCYGLLNAGGNMPAQILNELRHDVAALGGGDRPMKVNALISSSPVHRRARLTNISVREPASPNGASRIHTLVGIFTSKALAQECTNIPVIRKKFQTIVTSEGFRETTHDYKSVASIIDSLPKEAALGLDTEALRAIATSVLDVATSSETVTSVWPDDDASGLHILLVIMQRNYDSSVRDAIENYLHGIYGVVPVSSEQHLDITNRPVVRLYFYVSTAQENTKIPLETLREEIINRVQSWYKNLEMALELRYENAAARRLLAKYEDAFTDEYRALQSVQDCAEDIALIEKLDAAHPIQVGIANVSKADPSHATIVVHALTEVTISQAVPVLENCGFLVINERSWKISPSSGQSITSNRFRVHTKSALAINFERFVSTVAGGIMHALVSGRDNDVLNVLMLESGLDLRAIAVLRTYCRFLWQVKRFANRSSIFRTLAKNPELSAKLWTIFDILFNPRHPDSLDARRARVRHESEEFAEILRSVKDITSDRIFRSLLSLLENTVRTNLYLDCGSIALKFRSSAIDVMPQPRPLFEIFVNSPAVEGVHLRSGMVARGGIRWSDRPDDYRSEVLGLMKTQRVKNALIVPTGSKGGFIVKNLPSDAKLVPAAVKLAYSEYIRALLSITDNRKQEKILRAPEVLAYDGDDPYLVVAADKGTATFSDIANGIAANEFSFWLGDAFASGGSNGFDHKKCAITARGTWECVKRHSRDLGKDFEREPFTAIGIGDMSGDVFGNGLILSDRFKLVGAFDHKHIFIDPNPDPLQSFQERKRLFSAKGSQWSDYKAGAISRGGGVFDRFEKEITLSVEARAALGVAADVPATLSGETVINIILKAPVDLFWNGGIGTYVKARFQSHADVNDGANDGVRVSADELRCKAVGEGGNLGFTQQARIEFAYRGGAINTDAIDNSAGVDLSDHEVNLKILCGGLLRSGELTVENRNTALQLMSDDVCASVLEHNRNHALLLTLAQKRSAKNIHYVQALLRDFSKLGYLNRSLDSLPDDDELLDRQKNEIGLTRPEIAMCMAAAKMWIKDVLLSSDILDEPLLKPLLLEYFPRIARERWEKEIFSHPLAKNILASQIANILVDGMGTTAVHRLSTQFAVTPARVIECALTCELLFNTRRVRAILSGSELEIGTQTFLHLAQSLSNALFDTTAWLISRHGGSTHLAALYGRYAESWKEFRSTAQSMLPSGVRERLAERRKHLIDLRIDPVDADALALFPDVSTVFDLLWCAQQGKHSLSDAAIVYSEVLEQLVVDPLLSRCNIVETRNRWESELLDGTVHDIRGSVAELTLQLLSEHRLRSEEINAFLQQTVALDRWRVSVEETRLRTPDVASLAVLARQLQAFARA